MKHIKLLETVTYTLQFYLYVYENSSTKTQKHSLTTLKHSSRTLHFSLQKPSTPHSTPYSLVVFISHITY